MGGEMSNILEFMNYYDEMCGKHKCTDNYAHRE